MRALAKLELHASHACNLTCESCSHLSNHGHTGSITVEEADRQMGLWSGRIAPEHFLLLGGEPTLNPRLADLVRLARRHFPGALVEVTSNGFFLDRHPELPAALMGGRLVLSQHSSDPDYLDRFARAEALALDWARSGLTTIIRKMPGAWTMRYEGYGPAMRPLGTGDARTAWQNCPARHCVQLHDGRLWKCPFLAYMPMQVARFPELERPWRAMLDYQALDATAGDEELAAFLAREEEPACGLCPPVPPPFDPRDVLVPARRLLQRSRSSPGEA
jgi:hypothetical protein